jgi:dTDP-4-amino-4,6-dideoxygalactose transaminase
MSEIMRIANKYNLKILEDCAQAHFAEWNNEYVGTIGNAGTFSFFPGKNLGAYGDAGCIITNDDELAEKARMFANHGALIKHEHHIEGINSRLDGLQAAILSVKLKYIELWTRLRIDRAEHYNALFSELENIKTPKIHPGSKHVFHLYVIQVEKREELQKYLKESGIASAVHYPVPLPFMKAYDYLEHSYNDFPQIYEAHLKILSLPMFPELTNDEIEFIVNKILSFD